MNTRESYLGLSDLLERDLSAYEFYQSLPAEIQQKAMEDDVGSFDELQWLAQENEDRGF